MLLFKFGGFVHVLDWAICLGVTRRGLDSVGESFLLVAFISLGYQSKDISSYQSLSFSLFCANRSSPEFEQLDWCRSFFLLV